jgi:hypothetical protein
MAGITVAKAILLSTIIVLLSAIRIEPFAVALGLVILITFVISVKLDTR